MFREEDYLADRTLQDGEDDDVSYVDSKSRQDGKDEGIQVVDKGIACLCNSHDNRHG